MAFGTVVPPAQDAEPVRECGTCGTAKDGLTVEECNDDPEERRSEVSEKFESGDTFPEAAAAWNKEITGETI